MAEFPKPVRMGGVWKQDGGTMRGCGYEFRIAPSEVKHAVEIFGVGDKCIGRMWPNEKGPKFSGSLGRGVRCKLWFNDRKQAGDNRPDYDFQIETDTREGTYSDQGASGPTPAPGGGATPDDDLPF